MFWNNCDYKLIWAYQKAHKEKHKQRRLYDNQLSWMNGLYVRMGVGSLLDGKEYPDMIDLAEMDQQIEEEMKLSEEDIIKIKKEQEEIALMIQMHNAQKILKQRKGDS